MQKNVGLDELYESYKYLNINIMYQILVVLITAKDFTQFNYSFWY